MEMITKWLRKHFSEDPTNFIGHKIITEEDSPMGTTEGESFLRSFYMRVICVRTGVLPQIAGTPWCAPTGI